MKASEINALSIDKLQEKVAEYRQELMNLRFQHATAQLENTQRISGVRKNIARILGALREKEMVS
ncbi:MAG: 50S ribosomal protein L29 [Desulfoplanes sp.]|jgi:large subunit ribosomal protein L29|nr:50S ribosomal protein L29 [Desulfoplanes sp.]